MPPEPETSVLCLVLLTGTGTSVRRRAAAAPDSSRFPNRPGSCRRSSHVSDVTDLSLYQVARRQRQAGGLTATGKQWWSRTIVWHILQTPLTKVRQPTGNRRQRLRPLRGHPIHLRHNHSTGAVDRQDWISIPVPALIDEVLFDAAQAQLCENRTRAREGRRHPGYLVHGLNCSKKGWAQNKTVRNETFAPAHDERLTR